MKLKKLFLFAVLCLTCINVYADPDPIYYIDEDAHLIYTLDENTKTAMVGNGIDRDHNAFAYSQIGDYENYWINVVVPSTITLNSEEYTVTSVAWHAFARTTSTQSITLPNTITDISAGAFYLCTSLETIILPQSLSAISASMFESCPNLQSVTLPSTISSIGERAFYNCSLLHSITIPGNCSEIGDEAFTWCIRLDSIIFEDGPTALSLGYAYDLGLDAGLNETSNYQKPFWRGLFADCPLKYIYIGRDFVVPSFSQYSPFERCIFQGFDSYPPYNQLISRTGKHIDTVEFGPMVTDILKGIFSDAHINNPITLPRNVITIGEVAFKSALVQNDLVIPASCQSIGSLAFAPLNQTDGIRTVWIHAQTPPTGTGLPYNLSVHVPSGCGAAYRNNASWGNGYFTIIDPSDNLLSINVRYAGSLYGRLAFEDVEPQDVYRLRLTGTLNTDDWEVVNSMNNLYDLDISALNVDSLAISSGVLKKLASLQLPTSLRVIGSQQFQDSHLQGELVIPSSCERIERLAFEGSTIQRLVINGPTNVQEKAFSNCENLKAVVINDSACLNEESLGFLANLDSVKIAKGCRIMSKAFEKGLNPASIKKLVFADSVAYIADDAFFQVSINSLVFEGSVASLNETFASSQKTLAELHINDIGKWCQMSFANASSNPLSFAQNVVIENQTLNEIIIPNGVASIGRYCFASCSGLQKIVIPNTVATLSEGCFYNCENLNKIIVPTNLSSLGAKVFMGCSSLETISIPSCITAISSSCFEGCTSLTTISLNNTRKIQDRAFWGCSSLQNIVMSPSLLNIGEEAFANCTNITSFQFPISLEEIGERAFSGCASLKRLRALWINPITVTTNTFNNLNKKCILLVPINSVPNYYAAGWGRIPLIDEGFYTVTIDANKGGAVYCEDYLVGTTIESVAIDFDAAAHVEMTPNQSFYLKQVLLNDQNLKESVINGNLTIPYQEENISLVIRFARFVPGDVNDDDYVDVGDISAVVGHIQHTPVSEFISEAADVNEDGDIDVGDITGIVNIINADANNSPIRALQDIDGYITEDSYSVGMQIDMMGDTAYISIRINNGETVYGFQMDMQIPDGFYIPTDANGRNLIQMNANRLADMDIQSAVRLNDNTYRVLCSSISKESIFGSQGEVISFPLCKMPDVANGGYNLQITDARIVDSNAHVWHYQISEMMNVNGIATSINSFNRVNDTQKQLINGTIRIFKGGAQYDLLGNRIK